jgi:hypothetical protein
MDRRQPLRREEGSTMPADHEDDEGPPGAQDDLNEEGHASPNASGELLGASGGDSIWELVSLSEHIAHLELTARLDVQGNEQVFTNIGDIGSTNPSIEMATAANSSQYSEESQVCGSTGKTARGEGIEGLKTTGLESDTVSICYCFALREDAFSHSIEPSRLQRSRLILGNLRAKWILP